MDTSVLVTSGSVLVKALDDKGLKVRAAVWVYNSETDAWKLWMVPDAAHSDKAAFYLQLAEIITANRDALPGFDIGLVEFKSADNPAINGLSKFIRMEGLGNARLSNNVLNGTYVPDGIVLRMAV